MNKKLFVSILALMITGAALAQKQFKSWNKNLVIAHRGAWKTQNLPENSIASLKEAIRIGCYGSEFDVQLTADGVPVVNHNADFLGKDIASSTYQELVDYKKLSNGESIPTLEEYLKAGLDQKKTKLILEIKPQKNELKEEELAKKVIATVNKLKAAPWVEYISFSHYICKYVIANVPGARVSYLKGEIAPAQLKAEGFYGLDYNQNVFKKNPDWIAQSKKLGLAINVWTVNAAKDMDWFLAQKVENITTNEPELLFTKVKK
jgi:glycerophosphoryl diester phosphodiesterase